MLPSVIVLSGLLTTTLYTCAAVGVIELAVLLLKVIPSVFAAETLEPTIPGARIVHAGALIRAKYGEKSPELRKAESRGIQSCMGGTVYD